jgi:hypothetical protein
VLGFWQRADDDLESAGWPGYPAAGSLLSPCAQRSQRGTPLVPRIAQASVIQPLNGDPFVSMLETPVTSSPLVVSYLSNLPAYRTGVSPLLRGVEIGLAHGFFLPGPFIKVGAWRGVRSQRAGGAARSASGAEQQARRKRGAGALSRWLQSQLPFSLAWPAL